MTKNLRIALLATAAAGVMGLGMASANAVPVSSVLYHGKQTLSDNSAEVLINAGGATDTTLDVGDRLRGVLAIDTVSQIGPTRSFAANGVELSGFFDITVASKTAMGNVGPAGVCGSAWCYTFAPTASFAAEVAGLGFSNTAGAMIAFFEDTTPDFDRTGSVALGEATATDGNPYWLFGLASATDFWFANTATDDVDDIPLFPPPLGAGQFNTGLSILDNPFGPDLLPVACLFGPVTGGCASGALNAPDAGDFPSWDDVNIAINVVPEPTTLGILGLSLAAMGFVSRRRRK
jgi:hypothetical protein